MQSVHGQDAAIQQLLSLKSFEENFDIQEFVTLISERLIAESKDNPGPFDPNPFIRTFESAVDTLLTIRKDVQTRTETMEARVKVEERDYSKKLTELNSGFEAVGKSFGSMESKISQVGRTAIRIGEQLESIHIARQRAQAAHDLIDYYNQFAHSNTTRLDALRKDGGKTGRQQVAVILRRLVTVAKEVDLPDAEETRNAIDKYCESFEKDMLRLFDRSYRKGDPKMMAHCAQTLLDFNGGASCVQIYVNQHDFFISKSKLQEINTTENGDMWTTLPDPDASPPKTEPGLIALFDEIRSTVDQEAQIIQAVFPNPPVVMQVFLQRVFAQSIQQYFELLLNKAQSLSTLSFLRTLQLAHVQTSKLIDDLKTYDLASSTTTATPTSIDTDATRPIAGSGPTLALGTMLENAMEELFVPFVEGSGSNGTDKYLERESKSLGELYVTFLERFTKFHEEALKIKSSNLFDRLAQFTNNATTPTTSSTSSTAAAAFLNISGRLRGAGANLPAPEQAKEKEREKAVVTDGPPPLTEGDGRLSVEIGEKILKWHAEAVGRCVELSTPSDLPKNAFALMRVLAEALGRSYVETAIDAAQTRLENRDVKLEPDLQPFYTLKEADMICHLWQQYVTIALLPLANSAVTLRREMGIFNNQTISRIEGAANGMLEKVADMIITWLGSQLAKQKKNDFKPKNDDLSFARDNTEPCEACCDVLEKVRDAAQDNLSGKNLEVFLTEIGVAFHSLLLDHMKKFPVSATGGLMLAKDLKMYQDTIATFSLPALSERFEFIRQLGNVFLVRPEILKSYITENLGRIEPTLLRPFLMQRSDWSQFERGFDGESVVENENSKGIKERLAAVGRLGAMMRDLDNLRIGPDSSGSGSGEGLSRNSLFHPMTLSFNGHH